MAYMNVLANMPQQNPNLNANTLLPKKRQPPPCTRRATSSACCGSGTCWRWAMLRSKILSGVRAKKIAAHWPALAERVWELVVEHVTAVASQAAADADGAIVPQTATAGKAAARAPRQKVLALEQIQEQL
jgi:hypothetical protein